MARPQKFRLSPEDVLDPQNARKLAGHVAEIEFFRVEVEKLQAQIAGVYDAADEEGFDKKFIRKVVAIRAKDETVAQAEQAGIDAYTEALEIGFRSRARVENPEHDAETGEITETGIAVSNESDAAMRPQTGGSETLVANSQPVSGMLDAGERDGLAGPALSGDDQQANIKPAITSQPETIPPVAHPATVVSATGDGDSTDSSPDAVPGADRSKPNPWCLDHEECGLSSWDHFCLRCQRVKAERMSVSAVQ